MLYISKTFASVEKVKLRGFNANQIGNDAKRIEEIGNRIEEFVNLLGKPPAARFTNNQQIQLTGFEIVYSFFIFVEIYL
jgi:hypothetical protein